MCLLLIKYELEKQNPLYAKMVNKVNIYIKLIAVTVKLIKQIYIKIYVNN